MLIRSSKPSLLVDRRRLGFAILSAGERQVGERRRTSFSVYSMYFVPIASSLLVSELSFMWLDFTSIILFCEFRGESGERGEMLPFKRLIESFLSVLTKRCSF